MKMNARQMFEALGYEYRKTDIMIEYSWDNESIVFWIDEHKFTAGWYGDAKEIDVDEFKAIQQQMKELNWI